MAKITITVDAPAELKQEFAEVYGFDSEKYNLDDFVQSRVESFFLQVIQGRRASAAAEAARQAEIASTVSEVEISKPLEAIALDAVVEEIIN